MLSSKTICLTRTPEQSAPLAAALKQRGAYVIEFPTIELVPPPDETIIKQAIAKLDTYDWLIFTSANAAEHFFMYVSPSRHSGLDPESIFPQVAAVGTATATALATHGITDITIPNDFKAEGLIELFKASSASGQRVLIPRALHAREILPDTLRELGYEVTVAPVYETVQARPSTKKLEELTDGHRLHCDALVFTSPSTARNFIDILNDAGYQAASLIQTVETFSIGSVTTTELITLGFDATRIHESTQSTSTTLVDTLASFYTF
jgi:uroporphyrinogen III methyltransferase/synthase